MKKIVMIYSGGLDSTVLLHHYRAMWREAELHAISFNYGQKHIKELNSARHHVGLVDAKHITVNIEFLSDLVTSALTKKEVDVPDGHYAQENMSITVVPNRNSIMLNIAMAYAVEIGADILATGVHSGDSYVYPDCRPHFIRATETALSVGNSGMIKPDFRLEAPFMYINKEDIVKVGSYFPDLYKTWSCYNGRDKHCGTCGTCLERRLAFILAEVEDLTEYESGLLDTPEAAEACIKEFNQKEAWNLSPYSRSQFDAVVKGESGVEW